MKSWWSVWKATQRARILMALFWMGVTLVATVFIARYFAGSNGLDLVRLQLSPGAAISVVLSPWMFVLLILWGLLAWWFVWPKGSEWEAKEVTIDVAKIGTVKLTPNQEVAGIAHRAWAEIVTRKGGVSFDEESDVIIEVYDSWYKLFGEIRSLIKAIPVEKLRASEDAQKLCDYLLQVLNDVLRPHLTKHQAAFRAWFENEMAEKRKISPQELQMSYPS